MDSDQQISQGKLTDVLFFWFDSRARFSPFIVIFISF